MKKTLIALICLAAFSSESFSQIRQINSAAPKLMAPRPLPVFEYLDVLLSPKLNGVKMLAELHNTDGKLMMSQLLTGPIICLYTGDLPLGMYVLQLSWKGGSITYPVIKNDTR